jgi:hypothetical protein
VIKCLLFIFLSLDSGLVWAQANRYFFKTTVTFDSSQKSLSFEAEKYLADFIEQEKILFLQQMNSQGFDSQSGTISASSIVVVSRTDARGSASANQQISQERANNLAGILQILLFEREISMENAAISALGVGESEADESLCKQVEYICKNEIKHRIEKIGILNGLLVQLGDLLIPSAHAFQSGTILDILFGDEKRRKRQEIPDNLFTNTRRKEPGLLESIFGDENLKNSRWPENRSDQQRNNPQYWEPNNNAITPDTFQNYGPAASCERINWDQTCLEGQRQSTIEVELEFIPHQAVELPSPSITHIIPAPQPQGSGAAVFEPSIVRKDLPSPNMPSQKREETVQQQNPVVEDSKIIENGVAPVNGEPSLQEVPEKKKPKKLRVYGQPLENEGN